MKARLFNYRKIKMKYRNRTLFDVYNCESRIKIKTLALAELSFAGRSLKLKQVYAYINFQGLILLRQHIMP